MLITVSNAQQRAGGFLSPAAVFSRSRLPRAPFFPLGPNPGTDGAALALHFCCRFRGNWLAQLYPGGQEGNHISIRNFP